MPFHGKFGTNQYVVAWLRKGTDADGQSAVEDEARELDCRYDDTQREVTGPDGEPIRIDATISGFDCELPISTAVWKGRIADLPDGFVPTSKVLKVATYTATDDWRGRDTFREAGLTFAKGSLPSLSQ